MAWGYGGNGRLGNNATLDSHVPVPVSGLTGVTAISAGGAIGYALTSDGHVHTWGYGAVPLLATAPRTDAKTPVTVSNLTGATLGVGATSNSAYAIVGRAAPTSRLPSSPAGRSGSHRKAGGARRRRR